MTTTPVVEDERRIHVGMDRSDSTQHVPAQCPIEVALNLPSACPLCDSEHISYTYLPRADTSGRGTLVFRCTGCASYIESLVSDLDPPIDCPMPASQSTPARHAEPIDAERHQPTAPQRSRTW